MQKGFFKTAVIEMVQHTQYGVISKKYAQPYLCII